MKEIDHTTFIQEWKLNLDTSAYLNKLDKKERLLLNKNNVFGRVANIFGQKRLLKT